MLRLIEFDFISPEVVNNLNGNGYRVYLLPLRGDKLYLLTPNSDKVLSVWRVCGSERIFLGMTSHNVTAGKNLCIPRDNPAHKPAVHPHMMAICAIKLREDEVGPTTKAEALSFMPQQ